MSLEVSILASGSSGNCIYVRSPKGQLFVDAGLSCKQTEQRCAQLGIDPATINAICVTHEHDDHRGGIRVLHNRYGMALYANAGTLDALGRDKPLQQLNWNVFTTGQPFQVADMQLFPFSVPHDSYDPVGFVIACEGSRIAVVTDMGMATELIRERLTGCRLIVLECNYDVDMLQHSSRPWSLKQRIMGRQGHLSNLQAGELLAAVAGPQLQTVFLAHISDDCNHPEVAIRTVREALATAGHTHVAIHAAYGDAPTPLIAVRA
ncbi:MAG: MBL fold metallo-hydrolase [Verrucomicrobia bacterium]|nr:MBL fold metallo-hydrolase [Verrucomicrobiota bacterium]